MPAEFLVEVFQRCGVRVPMHVISLGISETFTYAPRTADKPFRILCIGDRANRKGWQIAGGAFVNAFGDDPNYELIIKTRGERFPHRFSNPNVKIMEIDLTDEEMDALYKTCHLMAFPTCGEGFGLPPREFAATGGIAIATNWGGTYDQLYSWALPIEFDLVTAWKGYPKLYGLGEWAQPRMNHVTNLMQAVAGLSISDYNTFGHQFSVAAKALYNWNVFAKQCWRVMEEVIDAAHIRHPAAG